MFATCSLPGEKLTLRQRRGQQRAGAPRLYDKDPHRTALFPCVSNSSPLTCYLHWLQQPAFQKCSFRCSPNPKHKWAPCWLSRQSHMPQACNTGSHLAYDLPHVLLPFLLFLDTLCCLFDLSPRILGNDSVINFKEMHVMFCYGMLIINHMLKQVLLLFCEMMALH